MPKKNSNKRARGQNKVKTFRKSFYFSVLSEIRSGLNPNQISKKYGLKKQNIAYYIATLKKQGFIKKVGYGTWEVTKKGEISTSQNFSRGGREVHPKIELWRLGYRFKVQHDNQIPELTTQKLKNGGYVQRGRINKCWVTKGKNTLDIYGSVSKSDNLWNAALLAIAEIVTTKGFLEDTYKLMLEPVAILRPDIIINTQETQRIASRINAELGRMRTELFDVDCSKTGKPELEARTIQAAQNTLDNLGVTNKADILESEIAEIKETMQGFLPQQTAISNALFAQSITLREMSKAITMIAEKIKLK